MSKSKIDLKSKTLRQKLVGFLHLSKNISLVDKILIFTAVFGFIFFIFVFFRKADYLTVTIKVGEDNAIFGDWLNYSGSRPWFTELLHPGVSQKDALGRKVAEVVSVTSYDMRPNREAVYVKTRLKVTFNRSSNQYVFNGIPLTVGSTVRMGFDTISFEGLVTNIENLPDFRQKAKIIVEAKLKEDTITYPGTSGVSPSVADEIKNINEVRDSEGNLIIKVIQKHVEDADTSTVDANGKITIQKNPLRNDVFLVLEINATKIGNRFYLFDDMPILIGEKIPLNTNKLSVFPEVTKITLDEK